MVQIGIVPFYCGKFTLLPKFSLNSDIG